MAGRGWQVTAVDYSEAALAMVHARDARIETVLADLEAGAFAIEPGAWNMICISFYMQRSLFGAIREGLAPCGLLVAAFPLAGMRQEFLMEPGELRGLFEEGFEILHYAENGRAAELFARKL